MFEDLRMRRPPKGLRRAPKRLKILLTIDRDVMTTIIKNKPRGTSRQEAIRQILQFYAFHKEIHE